MTMVKKSISITEKQNEWITARVSSGHYGNDSELIRELIRERQMAEEEQKNPAEIERIRELLRAAEKSGSRRVNAGELLAEFKRELRQNDKL